MYVQQPLNHRGSRPDRFSEVLAELVSQVSRPVPARRRPDSPAAENPPRPVAANQNPADDFSERLDRLLRRRSAPTPVAESDAPISRGVATVDDELAGVVAAWPRLPATVRAAVFRIATSAVR